MDCIKNQTTFRGNLRLGENLSQEFKKVAPELQEMIKTKPYDVSVETNQGKYLRSGITSFIANNFNYAKKPSDFAINAKVSILNSAEEYKNTMATLIKSMDQRQERVPNKLDVALDKPMKKVPFKERVKNFINSLFNKNAEKKG